MWRIVVLLILLISLFITLKPLKLPPPVVPSPVHTPYIDSALRPIVRDYLDTLKSHGLDISRFYRLDSILLVNDSQIICEDSTAIGCCDGHIVRIKRVPFIEWEDPQFYMKILVYHELGHCILRLPHHELFPAIMNSSMDKPLSHYKHMWSYYTEEYFAYITYINQHPQLRLPDAQN
jgi:hypothetical protein